MDTETHTHARKRPHEQKCRDHGDVSIRHELQEIPSEPLEIRRGLEQILLYCLQR